MMKSVRVKRLLAWIGAVARVLAWRKAFELLVDAVEKTGIGGLILGLYQKNWDGFLLGLIFIFLAATAALFLHKDKING